MRKQFTRSSHASAKSGFYLVSSSPGTIGGGVRRIRAILRQLYERFGPYAQHGVLVSGQRLPFLANLGVPNSCDNAD